MPLISGTVSRMPSPLESLAVWSVVTGLIFMFRTPGVAYNEAVVALLEEPCAYPVLRKFARTTAFVTAGLAGIVVATPLANLWFTVVANLPPDRATTARTTLAIAIPISIFSVYVHFFQGVIVQQEKTRPVAEATVVFLLALGAALISGMVAEVYKGVYVAAAGYTFAHLAQGLWLMLRSRRQRQTLSAC